MTSDTSIPFIVKREAQCGKFWLFATAPQLLAIGAVMLRMARDGTIDAFVLLMFAVALVIPALNIRNGLACLKRAKAFDPDAARARYGKTAFDVRQAVYNCAALLYRLIAGAVVDTSHGAAFPAFVVIVIVAYGPAVIASFYRITSVRRFARMLDVAPGGAGDDGTGGEADETTDGSQAVRETIYKREKNCAVLWILSSIAPAAVLVIMLGDYAHHDSDLIWPLFLIGLLSAACLARAVWGILKKLDPPAATARCGKVPAANDSFWMKLPSPILCLIILTPVVSLFNHAGMFVLCLIICGSIVPVWILSRNTAKNLMRMIEESGRVIGAEAASKAVGEICRSGTAYDTWLKVVTTVMYVIASIVLVVPAIMIWQG